MRARAGVRAERGRSLSDNDTGKTSCYERAGFRLVVGFIHLHRLLGNSHLAAECFLAEAIESFEEGRGVHYRFQAALPSWMTVA